MASPVSNLLMKLFRRSLHFGLVLAMLAGCIFGVYSYRLKRSADAIVGVAYELSGKEQPPTLQDVRQRFGSELKQPDPCTAYGCGYQIMVYNRVLAAVHLPYAVLKSYFWARNGVIDDNRLEFWTVGSQGVMGLSYVEVKYCDRCDSVVIAPWEGSSPLSATGSVEIGSVSSANMKRIALALDTGCLTRLRGCANIAELSPKVWQQTSSRTISCRIPTHEGIIDKPSDQP
jgi:hypothetical protein